MFHDMTCRIIIWPDITSIIIIIWPDKRSIIIWPDKQVLYYDLIKSIRTFYAPPPHSISSCFINAVDCVQVWTCSNHNRSQLHFQIKFLGQSYEILFIIKLVLIILYIFQELCLWETYKHTLLFQMVETVGFHTLLLSWRQSSAVEGLSKGFFRTLSLYLTLSLTKTLQDSVYISCNFNKCCPTCFYSWRRNSLLLSKSQTKGRQTLMFFV